MNQTKDLRLWEITDTSLSPPRTIPGLSFAEKQRAKEKRKALNGTEPPFRYIVSPGPDHRHHS